MTPNQKFSHIQREISKTDSLEAQARREAQQWWLYHGHDVASLADGEIRALATDMRLKGPQKAQVRMLARAPRAIWVAYRNSVTRRALALASRRVRVMQALERLGFAAARILASALLGL